MPGETGALSLCLRVTMDRFVCVEYFSQHVYLTLGFIWHLRVCVCVWGCLKCRYVLRLRQTACLPAAVEGHDAAQCLPMMLAVWIRNSIG